MSDRMKKLISISRLAAPRLLLVAARRSGGQTE
jgi:hypothetical protein